MFRRTHVRHFFVSDFFVFIVEKIHPRSSFGFVVRFVLLRIFYFGTTSVARVTQSIRLLRAILQLTLQFGHAIHHRVRAICSTTYYAPMHVRRKGFPTMQQQVGKKTTHLQLKYHIICRHIPTHTQKRNRNTYIHQTTISKRLQHNTYASNKCHVHTYSYLIKGKSTSFLIKKKKNSQQQAKRCLEARAINTIFPKNNIRRFTHRYKV